MEPKEQRVIFSWSKEEAWDLLSSCEQDGIFPIVRSHIAPGARVLEAGCGMGRYLRYLADRGWRLVGLELGEGTVRAVKEVWPDLAIVAGDVVFSPFRTESFDAVISLGVVEHFIEGPERALKEIHRVLKPAGTAIITVPCLNTVRRLKRAVGWYEIAALPRALGACLLKGKPKKPTRFNPQHKYIVYPAYGPFFEYRMTPKQFEEEVLGAGFKIKSHRPHALIDGIYHDLNPLGLLIGFKKWKFQVTALGDRLNTLLARYPFFCSHMQVIVAVKS